MAANAARGDASDITPSPFVQSTRAAGYRTGGVGDVSFGSVTSAGPATSRARRSHTNLSCQACTTVLPGGSTVYSVGASSTKFRIARLRPAASPGAGVPRPPAPSAGAERRARKRTGRRIP